MMILIQQMEFLYFLNLSGLANHYLIEKNTDEDVIEAFIKAI